jgi:uracil-DNA glycosylase family 4
MYKSLKEVYRDVYNCEKCELVKTRTNVVFGEGSLRAKLMFIGEGPGAKEDELARPFVGPAGQLLDKMIEAIGLKREEVYIANVVKCRPAFNSDPKPEYANACLPYLREQVRFIRPKVIVCLGRIAMQYILKEPLGITRVHGKVYDKKGFYIVPTFHPSALLRNEDLKQPAWEDFKVIKDLLMSTEKHDAT